MNNLEDKLAKNQRINVLLDIYENLLTDKQTEYMTEYYRNDLSLAEIAEEFNVSRNAVFDNIKKATASLEKYEKKLGLLNKYIERQKIIAKIETDLDNKNKNIEEHLQMLKDL